ncbi:MAG TPA: hypothetical protein VGM18_18765 [Candidatus Sulfotelmatobacter sp.]|jgi:hypothetical protein
MTDETRVELDRVLDAALADYAAVEPRAGLEERILANLRAEPMHVGGARWKWGWAAAVAGVALIVLTLSWLQRPTPTVASHPSGARQSPPQSGTELSSRAAVEVPLRAHERIRKTAARRFPRTAVAGGPKLDVFPSPQPLTEQEKLLAGYVAEYPEHAVLLARAQAEDLRRDEKEEMRESGAVSGDNSQQLTK